MKSAQRKKIALLVVANWCSNAETTMFEGVADVSEKDQGLIVDEIHKLSQGAPCFHTVNEIVKSVLNKK